MSSCIMQTSFMHYSMRYKAGPVGTPLLHVHGQFSTATPVSVCIINSSCWCKVPDRSQTYSRREMSVCNVAFLYKNVKQAVHLKWNKHQ